MCTTNGLLREKNASKMHYDTAAFIWKSRKKEENNLERSRTTRKIYVAGDFFSRSLPLTSKIEMRHYGECIDGLEMDEWEKKTLL